MLNTSKVISKDTRKILHTLYVFLVVSARFYLLEREYVELMIRDVLEDIGKSSTFVKDGQDFTLI